MTVVRSTLPRGGGKRQGPKHVLETVRRDGAELVYRVGSDGSRTLFTRRTIPPKGARGFSKKATREYAVGRPRDEITTPKPIPKSTKTKATPAQIRAAAKMPRAKRGVGPVLGIRVAKFTTTCPACRTQIQAGTPYAISAGRVVHAKCPSIAEATRARTQS